MFNERVARYVMYHLCQNWLNLRDPSSFYQSSEKARRELPVKIISQRYKASELLIIAIISVLLKIKTLVHVNSSLVIFDTHFKQRGRIN